MLKPKKRILPLTLLCMAACATPQPDRVRLTDGVRIIAETTTANGPTRPFAIRFETVTLGALGELSIVGQGCRLVVDRPGMRAFRYAAPKCTISVEARRICIDRVVLQDELAITNEQPVALQLSGCAERELPPVVIIAPEKPPEPKLVCLPMNTVRGKRVADVSISHGSKDFEVKVEDGSWSLCYWGYLAESFSFKAEFLYDDGTTGTGYFGRTVSH